MKSWTYRLTDLQTYGPFCAVCFGKSDNPNIVKAFSFGIIILLGCTLAAMTLIAYMFYKIEKNRAAS